jgi:hypothetical protein
MGESKVKHAFGCIALKKVFVDQTIPFAECRQKQ